MSVPVSDMHTCLSESVVALFGLSNGMAVFLGSAFFVSEQGLLVTAAHVLPADVEADWPIVFTFGRGASYAAEVVSVCSETDLALLSTDYRPTQWLSLGNEVDGCMFEEVACYEYSSTEIRQVGPMAHIRATSSGRIGTITRIIPRNELEGLRRLQNIDLLVVSFPTLSGMSGSPVIRRSDGRVVGIIVQSWSIDAPSAEIQEIIETTTELGNDRNEAWPRREVKEVRRLMVPQGLAVHVRYVSALLTAARSS